jgi:hypothetical protein
MHGKLTQTERHMPHGMEWTYLISWRQCVRTRGVKILLLVVSAIISGVLCFWNGFRPQSDILSRIPMYCAFSLSISGVSRAQSIQ